MNLALVHRKQLEARNLVIKATAKKSHWLSLSPRQIARYTSQYGTNFNIIVAASNDPLDFYVIPYPIVAAFLKPAQKGRIRKDGTRRWDFTIVKHQLRIKKLRADLLPYHGNKIDLVAAVLDQKKVVRIFAHVMADAID